MTLCSVIMGAVLVMKIVTFSPTFRIKTANKI